jgi:hypothetical protein
MAAENHFFRDFPRPEPARGKDATSNGFQGLKSGVRCAVSVRQSLDPA